MGTLRLVLRYARERSPLPVTGLLAALLFLPAIVGTEAGALLVLRGWATMALFLFLVRLSDDLSDVGIDRVTHPERLLCAESTDVAAIRRFRLALVLAMLALQGVRVERLVLVAATCLAFGLFFRGKARIPAGLQPVALNASLLVFPVYAGVLVRGTVGAPELGLGAFFWLGGLGHDCSHCIIDPGSGPPEALHPLNRIDPRRLAWLSLALFAASAAVGFVLVDLGWVERAFGIALAVTSAIVLALEVRLIRRPRAETAKPFYAMGFAFFLVPALAHLVAGWAG